MRLSYAEILSFSIPTGIVRFVVESYSFRFLFNIFFHLCIIKCIFVSIVFHRIEQNICWLVLLLERKWYPKSKEMEMKMKRREKKRSRLINTKNKEIFLLKFMWKGIELVVAFASRLLNTKEENRFCFSFRLASRIYLMLSLHFVYFLFALFLLSLQDFKMVRRLIVQFMVVEKRGLKY